MYYLGWLIIQEITNKCNGEYVTFQESFCLFYPEFQVIRMIKTGQTAIKIQNNYGLIIFYLSLDRIK
jgi:hypothetical protein